VTTAASSAVRLASRIALLVILLAAAVLLTVRPTLGDEDTFEKESPITQVVKRGPVEVDDLEWKLESLKVYTRLVNAETQEPVDLEVPDGATIVMATMSLKPNERTILNDGFACDAELMDDRGNLWEDENAFGIALPTYCGDDELKIERGKAFKIAKVFVVPKEAVPHLTGVITPESGTLSADRRVLITP
jgi:hypothetical protein